jgi:hypothetical protein
MAARDTMSDAQSDRSDAGAEIEDGPASTAAARSTASTATR